ncbi:MAG: hypothetical protein FJX71_00090 [Alphaproteobacteria bacterium]|nr:hypothetical protein [Alphaproteobacteria bacterium]
MKNSKLFKMKILLMMLLCHSLSPLTLAATISDSSQSHEQNTTQEESSQNLKTEIKYLKERIKFLEENIRGLTNNLAKGLGSKDDLLQAPSEKKYYENVASRDAYFHSTLSALESLGRMFQTHFEQQRLKHTQFQMQLDQLRQEMNALRGMIFARPPTH